MFRLFWTDISNNKYHLGNLNKIDNIYYFEIIEENLKKAIKHGCFGIGDIDITKRTHKSKELFNFFKNRIPSREALNNKELLQRHFGLTEYDEMEILKVTSGKLITDRYYVEYAEENRI